MPCGVVWGIKVEDEGDVVLDVDGGEWPCLVQEEVGGQP
jgi:hypothetical protein